MSAKINKIKDIEYIEIKITEDRFPIVYQNKLAELMEDGLSEEDAREKLKNYVVEMELIYEKGYGLFLVESDAIYCGNVYSPYSQTLCEESE